MSEASTGSSDDNVIDRVYDGLEHGVHALGAMLGVDLSDEVKAERAHRGIGRQLPAAPAPSSGVQVRPFEIIESIDNATGATQWTVTNGTISRDCPSEDFARTVLKILRERGAR